MGLHPLPPRVREGTGGCIATPYVTPATLIAAPTGIGWSTIPVRNGTEQQQLAEQTNICWRATHDIDAMCNQPLRADLALETETGPGFRLTIPTSGSGAARLVTQRSPVTEIIGGQYSPSSAFPPVWTPIPASSFMAGAGSIQTLGNSMPDASGAGSYFIDIAPGYITWINGRDGTRLQVAYISGWAHTSLTSAVAASATTLAVDDVTGWLGTMGQIYDGALTESFTVTAVSADNPTTVFGASVPTGPGTLTLSSPLAYAHTSGILATALPYSVVWAAVLLCVAQALTRGATAITGPSMPGAMTHPGSPDECKVEAEALITPYRRPI